ncbi:tRNA (N6-threonylcarbamoyladenosine(37)-N6)-methyltransferase TrmO [Streptomyces sp. NPDC020917]|uniref:tRNA (N6-threonylcarbamoyladenosine(37)-N6)-methyltransferase TrmO n=1 Tax=Streptomyces sp. NPDC020917 TaxID=3365102 RepID=UPI003788A7B5
MTREHPDGGPGTSYPVVPVGRVESPLHDRDAAPRQGDEDAPEAWLAFGAAYGPALRDLAPGDDVLLFTWLDRADRTRLTVHPRGDASRAEQGVFSTRSPDRPNPIGLHRVRILAIDADGSRLHVSGLEALDGTPVLDVKPVLGDIADR